MSEKKSKQAEKWLLELYQLRKAMGTLPESQPERRDDIFIGVENIKVKLVDYPKNPYRAIYEIVTSTWGGRDRWFKRWENTTPQGRLFAVMAALQGHTLQQALEAPSFIFIIDGLSRSAFDQLARHRFSAIGSVGMRDNNWLDAALRVPWPIAKNRRFMEKIQYWWRITKDLYHEMIEQGQQSWQNARAILPMGVCWRFSWTMNYRALKDILAKRLMFCEQWDTVATAWLMRREIEKKFPLLAAFLRPACDFAKRCLYHQLYSLSQAFGCLFKPCGRWPSGEVTVATFPNEAAADKKVIESQLNISIPESTDWPKIVEEAKKKDFKYFEED